MKENFENDEEKDEKNQEVENVETPKIEKDPLREFREDISAKDKEISSLKKQISELKTTANNYLNTASYYKAQAEAHKKDFERYKERNKNIETEAGLKANSLVAKKLIPVVDNFNNAMAIMPPDVMRGFAMIYTSLMDILKELGVLEINPKNEKFDPEKHDCIEVIVTDDKNKDNFVARIYKKGYMLNVSNEIIRPATIAIYKYNENL